MPMVRLRAWTTYHRAARVEGKLNCIGVVRIVSHHVKSGAAAAVPKEPSCVHRIVKKIYLRGGGRWRHKTHVIQTNRCSVSVAEVWEHHNQL